MKLPEIQYGGSVQGTSQTAAMPYDAAAGLGKELAGGLQAYSQALLQSQQTNAAVKVSEGLNQAANVLKAKKFLTEAEIRDTLGGELPPALAERIKALPKDQIPTWAVGDTLYAHVAKRLVDDAAVGIDGTGWQTQFREGIRPHVSERQQGLAAYHLDALDKYLQADATSAFEKLVNARDYAGAKAAAFNPALPAEVQVKLAAAAETARQEDGARLALDSTDPAFIREQITRLNTDPAALKAIPAERRTGFIHSLEERWTKFEGSRLADEAFAKGVTPGALTLDEGAILSAVEESTKGGTPTLQKEARDLAKARIADFVEGRKSKTSNVFAAALQDFDKPGPLQFRVASISPAARSYLTNPANGREAAELWQSLLDKEHAHEMRGRGLANTPTEANWRAYGALVKDMADFPSKYRGMTGDRFTAEVYSKVGPLIGQAMAAYKSAVEPTVDKRVLGGDERRSILEALPPTYRPSKTTQPTSVQAQVWNGVVERIGERKAREWDNSKGPVPDAILKQWVAEEWASGTVKGGRYWGLVNAPGVPKAVAPVAYPGKEWTPDQPGAQPPPGAPAAPPAAPPAVPGAVVTPAQVPLVHRQRIVQDYRAKYGKAPSGADIVRGYNAGVAAGVF